VLRWRVEVTFEEVRAHQGVETQREWSDLAIACTTPALWGLFSVVTLLAHRLGAEAGLPARQAEWYRKASPPSLMPWLRYANVCGVRPIFQCPTQKPRW
jgi:hypothetical protein